ncbi:MAG: hypothetical protein AAF849_16125 [Bacteroidota bacterium]
MRKKLLLLGLLCLVCSTMVAQEVKDLCKENFELLSNQFIKINDSLVKEESAFNDLKNNLSDKSTQSNFEQIQEKIFIITSLKDSLNNIHQKSLYYKSFCTDNGFLEEEITAIYNHPYQIEETAQEESENTENNTYIYFNKNQIISENVVDNESQEGKILNSVLAIANQESYLGDITIPRDGQVFKFYKRETKTNKKTKKIRYTNNFILTDYRYKFKKIDLEIHDGNFTDVLVTIEHKGKTYVFENRVSISFLRYSKQSKINYLFYAHKKPSIVDESNYLDSMRIRLSDVLQYQYRIGQNYIPRDLTLQLPKNDIENEETNTTAPATYQVRENTYLDKVIEFRAYSDFFGLFGNSTNGLVQFESNAKFYLFPFARNIFNAQFELFKDIRPKVHYARFDEDDGFALVEDASISNPLDLVQKRFLTTGLDLNFFEVYHKNYAVKVNLYGFINYNLTNAGETSEDTQDIRAINYGPGLNFTTRRFNNFGFNYKIFLSWFDYKNFNGSVTDIELPDTVPIFSNQAEVFYHPNQSPNQAIFVRLTTFNYTGNSDNGAFFQFQFGYKFSLGSKVANRRVQ